MAPTLASLQPGSMRRRSLIEGQSILVTTLEATLPTGQSVGRNPALSLGQNPALSLGQSRGRNPALSGVQSSRGTPGRSRSAGRPTPQRPGSRDGTRSRGRGTAYALGRADRKGKGYAARGSRAALATPGGSSGRGNDLAESSGSFRNSPSCRAHRRDGRHARCAQGLNWRAAPSNVLTIDTISPSSVIYASEPR